MIGDSCGLTPFRSNLIDNVKCDIPVKDMEKVNRVIVIGTNINRFIGIGTNLHKFIESNCQYIFLPCISYHLTQTDVRLFSPQTYHQIHGGPSVAHGNQVTTNFPFNRIHIPVDLGGTNLPVAHNSFVTDNQKREIGPQMCSSLAYSRISNLDTFGDLNTIRSIQDMEISSKKTRIEHEFEHH